MDIMVIIETMIQLFLMLVLGYVLYKTKVFDDHVNKAVSSLVVNITAPLLVINSVSSVVLDDKTLVLKLIGGGLLFRFN